MAAKTETDQLSEMIRLLKETNQLREEREREQTQLITTLTQQLEAARQEVATAREAMDQLIAQLSAQVERLTRTTEAQVKLYQLSQTKTS